MTTLEASAAFRADVAVQNVKDGEERLRGLGHSEIVLVGKNNVKISVDDIIAPC